MYLPAILSDRPQGHRRLRFSFFLHLSKSKSRPTGQEQEPAQPSRLAAGEPRGPVRAAIAVAAVDEPYLDQPARPVNSPRKLSEGCRGIPPPPQRTDKAIPFTQTSLLLCCTFQKDQQAPRILCGLSPEEPQCCKTADQALGSQGSNNQPPARPCTAEKAITAKPKPCSA